MAAISAPRSAADAASQPTAARRQRAFEASHPVPWWGRVLLGAFLWALGATLLYLVIALWPAVQGAVGANEPQTITWFWITYTPTPDSALLILVVLVSALGSFVHAATSFTDYVGNRRLATSWIWWYLLRVVIGSALAILFYFALRGGFFAADTESSNINPYGIAAISGLVGLFSKQATDKLREVFDTAFRVAPGYGDEARDDAIVNPEPVLRASEPASLAQGTLELVLTGAGFTEESSVIVAQPGGDELPRRVTYLGPDRLGVTLEAEDVAAPGMLNVTVFNPEPGGGASRTLQLEVADEVSG